MTDAPHLVPVCAVRISGSDPRDRGLARGRALAHPIRATSAAYRGLFDQLGIGEQAQHDAVEASLTALRDWAPDLAAELQGVAEGAGLELHALGRTLARTEILTLAPAQPGECSTLAHQRTGGSVSAQTWDWYAELDNCWHLHRVDPIGGEVAHAGFTEYGMTGKVGLNAAGVGVHLNILKHRDDEPGGVPIHAVLARVLAEATSLDHGLDLIRSAATSSSSVLTLVEPDRVAMVEVSPRQVTVEERSGWLIHTNHFLAPEQQDGALLLDPQSTTHDRLDYLQASTERSPVPTAAEDLLPLLCSPLGSGGVALLPDLQVPPSERLATLVTVHLDPARRTIGLSPGVPQRSQEVTVTYRL